jgi:clan AA aspartic protease (TIGR02281 family)
LSSAGVGTAPGRGKPPGIAREIAMCRKRFVLWIGLVAVSSIAVAAADEKTAEALLKSKGLRKLSYCFSLPEESELSRGLRTAASLRKRAFDAQEKVDEAQKAVDDKDNLILAYVQKHRELGAQLGFARSTEQRNRIVVAYNEMADRVELLRQSKQEEEALDQARAVANTATEEYTEHLLELRRLHDDAHDRYQSLAADAAVVAAIEEYNKSTSRTCRLGPGPTFASNGRRLELLEKTVLSEAIELRRGLGGLWYVTAVFNGKGTLEIAIDTGASVIALSWENAQALGLTPGTDAPSMKIQVADGRVLEAKRVVAETVRVGKFTAKNVECTVMPPGLPGAGPLLGLSFLRNFSFKIDSAKGLLIMSQLDSSETPNRSRTARSRRPVRSSGPAATTRQDEPPQTTPAPQPADRSHELAQLLTPKGQPGEDVPRISVQIRPGEKAVFKPSVQGPAETLRKRFGPPDEVMRFQFTRPSQGGVRQEPFQYQLWVWGPVKVFVDENGTTRYFSATE